MEQHFIVGGFTQEFKQQGFQWDIGVQAVTEMAKGDHVRLEYQFPDRQVDISHERFGIDHNRCILCTRCVRVCDEIEGAHTWDMAGRGTNSHVITDLNQPWGTSQTCTSCGKCINACPTGALFSQGSSVGEMKRDRAELDFLITAREKKEWNF